jgi:hypothetical protein
MVDHPDRGDDPDATVPDSRPVGPADDATRPIRPVGDDATRRIEPADADADATRPIRPGDPDATQVQRPASDATQVQRPAGDDATKVAGPVDEAPRWAARANVPPPGTAPRTPAPSTWDDEGAPTEDPYGGRSWFTPVVVGILALMLAAGLGVGIYLIYEATKDNPPETGPSEAVTSAAATTAPPSSAPPSPSASPSPSPSTPTGVPIPTLRGQTEQSAKDALTTLGLTVVVQRRSDPSVEPGRVIGTDPPAGTAVADGATVTLIVASAPSPSPSKSPPAPSPSVAAS